MNSKTFRRLASEHANLHTQGLPPNYLWPQNSSSDLPDDLTALTLLIIGPEGTPYVDGIFQLNLNIPSGYPAAAPTASFKTRIFHPNVDEKTGSVCVDTLKRDWTPDTKLRDVLVVISCLLVSPNPASALNAEAGRLCEGDYAAFEKRARTWVNIHARVPPALRAAVDEARRRGDEGSTDGFDGGEGAHVNTLRRGRGKRRLVAGAEDAENGRESKRRSRSGSSHALRNAEPLVATADNALGIKDAIAERPVSVVETWPPATPRQSQQGPLTESRPSKGPSRQSSQLMAPLSQVDYPTFTTLNTTFNPDSTVQANPTLLQWDASACDGRLETPTRRAGRLEKEAQRMAAAGGDVRKYNTGTFGVRTGLFRL